MVNNCWLLLGCSSSHYVSNDTCGNPIFSAHIFPLRHSSCGNPASSSMLVMYLTILAGTLYSLPIFSHFDIRLARALLFYNVCHLLSFCFRKTSFFGQQPISSHFDIGLVGALLFYDVCHLLSFCSRKTLFDILPSHHCYISIIYLFL